MTGDLATMVNLALRIVSLRALIILALIANGVMFGWAMYVGGYDRLAIAAAFAVASWCLVHLRKESG